MVLRRILYVEDDANDIELTLEAFENSGLANKVDICRDGVQALAYLNCNGDYNSRTTGNPVAILLDLKMPKMGGLEVLRVVKANPDLMKIPIVVLTSSKEDSDLQECYSLGVNAYVVKPVDFKKFIEAVSLIGTFWGLLNEVDPSL